MKNTRAGKQGGFFKAPVRILTKARDFYIRSFSECAGQFDVNAGFGCPTVYVSTLPRSHSVGGSTRSMSSSSHEDYSELVRIASARGLSKKVETEFIRRQQSPTSTTAMMGGGNNNKKGVVLLPRSQSVAIGRIDEDSPCDFGDNVKVNANLIYPRSRSHAPLSV